MLLEHFFALYIKLKTKRRRLPSFVELPVWSSYEKTLSDKDINRINVRVYLKLSSLNSKKREKVTPE